MGFEEKGYLEYQELSELRSVPSQQRYQMGPVAIAECVQCIPCNPCETACKTGALTVGKPITNLPQVDYDRCTGCGMCIAKCPGMAIFVVDKTYSKSTATVSFPYEYYPLPEEGTEVYAVDRSGSVVCSGIIRSVRNPKSFDRTPVITVEIPKEYADEVRIIRRKESTDEIRRG